MTIADAITRGMELKVHAILDNAENIAAFGELPPEYDIATMVLCLHNRLIYTGGSTYRLTDKGEKKRQELEALFATRSNNGNVFVRSAYWGTWSRVLFHESDKKLAAKYRLEKQTWIELDLTAVNPQSPENWRDGVQHANIRCHCTSRGDKDIIVGTLPGHVVQLMRRNLTEDAVQKLLHADYLPYIDFEKGQKINNGGFHFADAAKEYMTSQQNLASLQAGPGVFLEDVQADYEAAKKTWDVRIDGLIIKGGLKC